MNTRSVPYSYPDVSVEHQPIAFSSKRLSGPARKWDACKREAYAIYHSVHAVSCYLKRQGVLGRDRPPQSPMDRNISVPDRLPLESPPPGLQLQDPAHPRTGEQGSRLDFLPCIERPPLLHGSVSTVYNHERPATRPCQLVARPPIYYARNICFPGKGAEFGIHAAGSPWRTEPAL